MAKKALVTGASEGIGRSIAIELKKAGYQITGVARNEAKLKSLAADLGGPTDYFVADLSTPAGQQKIVNVLQDDHYDVLINNAGVGTQGEFTEVPLDRQISMIRLNNEALVRLSHAFLSNSKAGDALVNISSVLSFIPMPSLGLYSATKAFVTALSETLWYEQKSRDVYVLGIHPGTTSTNFAVNSGGKSRDMANAPTQTPEEVAKAVIKELKARKNPTALTSLRGKVLLGFLTRMLPRKSVINIMGRMIKRRS